METTFTIGIDIGGTNTDVGLVRNDGQIIARQNLQTASYSDAQLFVNDIVIIIKELLQKNKIENVRGIGIGAPCGNLNDGSIDDAANLKFRGKTMLKSLFQSQINVPVVVTNDANAAAYGEMIYGGAKNLKHIVMFTLGTGVGGGIIIDGKLVVGADGFAGELGHTILIPNGRKCTCGNNGCIETYCSIRGVLQTCNELLSENPENELTLIKTLTPKIISEAANNGNSIAIETYRKTGEWLGIALANAVTFTSPEAIFLMGGVMKAGDILLQPTRESFLKNKLFVYKNEIPILISQLPENDVAILGAAALV